MFKCDSTKSFIPIFEQVATYEREKMGSEWKKSRKSTIIWQFILCGMLLFQSQLNKDSADRIANIDISFMIFFILLTIVMVNVSLLLHIRKVDRSEHELSLKGYTWKTNLKAVVVVIALSILLFIFSMWYLMMKI